MKIKSIAPTPVSPVVRIAATSNRAERIKTVHTMTRSESIAFSKQLFG